MRQRPQTIGRVIDRYRIEAELGQGGFGAVYRALHVHMHRRVALKILHPRYAENADVVERFMREARAAAAIGSKHIVDVYDCGMTPQGEAFLALELLDGEDLETRLARGPCSIDEAMSIGMDVLAGLAAAHDAGVIHRDLKPANIFLANTTHGVCAKLLDFGISKMVESQVEHLTREGVALGTPLYMALEQFTSARDVDGRADLYALGVAMYEMVSGAHPFEAKSFDAMMLKLATESPRSLKEVAPHCPDAFVRVVERALARDREARFPSARAMAEELRRVRSVPATRAFGAQPASHFPRGAISPSASLGPMRADPHGAVDPHGSTMMAPSAPPPRAVLASPPPAGALPTAECGPSSRGTSWLRVGLLGLVAAVLAAMGVVLLLDFLSPEDPSSPGAPASVASPTVSPSAVSPSAVSATTGLTAPAAGATKMPALAAPKPEQPRSRPMASGGMATMRRPQRSASPRREERSPQPADQAEPGMARQAPRIGGARFHPPRIIGSANPAGVAALLQRARPRLGRCQTPGIQRTVRVQVIARPDGEIALSQPAQGAERGDRRTAACVASVLRGLGPIAGGGSGIVQIAVDL